MNAMPVDSGENALFSASKKVDAAAQLWRGGRTVSCILRLNLLRGRSKCAAGIIRPLWRTQKENKGTANKCAA